MSDQFTMPLVSTDWLAANLDAVKIIDASWRMPGAGNAVDDYNQRHIDGATFFDIDAIADQASDLPHMLPGPEDFAQAIGAMGLAETDTVIVYDDQGVFSAPRAWWSFRAMGHQRVAVLDGGLKKWLGEGRPVTDAQPVREIAKYQPTPNRALVRQHEQLRDAIQTGNTQIIDARGSERFFGRAPEPRAGLRSGAIPGSKNTPFDSLLNDDGTLKAKASLETIFKSAGIDLSAPIITSCGSGVTAAVLSLALEQLGHNAWSLYDGSWAEWGREENDSDAFPVVKG